jgi:hypothetical protein
MRSLVSALKVLGGVLVLYDPLPENLTVAGGFYEVKTRGQ